MTSLEPLKTFSAEIQQHIIPEIVSIKKQLNWGRLICIWHEKIEDKVVTHTYAACIDGTEGGIYLDCRPGKVFAKCLAHTFVRPFHSLVKTIFQISLYPFFKELANSYHSPQSKTEKIINVFKTLADIVITPLSGIILTVASISVLIFGSFSSENLYEGRKLLGKMEQVSNWGKAHTSWTLAPCFQPFPFKAFENYQSIDFSQDTVYQDLSLTYRSLTHFARAHIKHKRRVFDLFSCSKLKPGISYKSPILIIPKEYLLA